MADTEMGLVRIQLDEVARTMKFVLRAKTPPDPPAGVSPDQWIGTPLEVVTQPINIQRGSATLPSGKYITYEEMPDGSTQERYWKVTRDANGVWSAPVEINQEGVPL